MQAMMTSLYNLMQTWQPLVIFLVAIVLFGSGIGCMIPSEKIKSMSRGALPWIVIGCGIALGATVIAKEISGAFAF